MSRNIPRVNRWKVTFEYRDGHNPTTATEWVYAPTRMLALWAAREQRHGCMIGDPDCVREVGPYIANIRKGA
jgi:hypothetical protein